MKQIRKMNVRMIVSVYFTTFWNRYFQSFLDFLLFNFKIRLKIFTKNLKSSMLLTERCFECSKHPYWFNILNITDVKLTLGKVSLYIVTSIRNPIVNPTVHAYKTCSSFKKQRVWDIDIFGTCAIKSHSNIDPSIWGGRYPDSSQDYPPTQTHIASKFECNPSRNVT